MSLQNLDYHFLNLKLYAERIESGENDEVVFTFYHQNRWKINEHQVIFYRSESSLQSLRSLTTTRSVVGM